jgi:hypothetical protein
MEFTTGFGHNFFETGTRTVNLSKIPYLIYLMSIFFLVDFTISYAISLFVFTQSVYTVNIISLKCIELSLTKPCEKFSGDPGKKWRRIKEKIYRCL